MPKGRMLNKKISQDNKVAKLSLKATLLYTWCIPYLDVEGKIYGDVWTLKSIVPHVKEITPDNIPSIVNEWVVVDLVTYYGDDSHKYLYFKGFMENQSINPDREAKSEIPSPELLQSNSGLTPAKVKLSKDNINVHSPIKEVLKNNTPADFDLAWQAYPNKLGKKQAEKHFYADIKRGKKLEDILKAIENYAKYRKDNNIEEKYIKHGSTFFNNWEDYLKYEPSKPKQRCDF
jgi:hypothetical protein